MPEWWAIAAVLLGVPSVGVALLVLGYHVRARRHRRRPDVPPMLGSTRPKLRAIDGGLPMAEALDALATAADDIDKAANQFASMRASQQRGHSPRVQRDPQIFAGKAERARLVHARLSKTSSAGASGSEPRHPSTSRGGVKGSEDSSSVAAPADGDHLRGVS